MKVVMRKGNASGRRAGAVLTLEVPEARKWIANGWCDQYDEPKAESKDQTIATAEE